MHLPSIAAFAAIMLATPVGAQQTTPVPPCPSMPAPLPAELAGWTSMTSLTAASRVTDTDRAMLTIGRGVRATLIATPKIAYAVAPAKAGSAASLGGMFAFVVRQDARYRVALGAGTWVDVVGGKRTIASAAHSHGPDCSPVRKMVDFDLKPGRYVLQIAGATQAILPLMIARLPN